MPSCLSPDRATQAASHRPARLNELTERRIRYRADRLARVFGLSPHDADDLYQDLYLEVWKALPRHQPGRGSLDAFTRGVMDLWYCQRARELRRANREPAVSAIGVSESNEAYVDPCARHVPAADVRLDLLPMIHNLPRGLTAIAGRLAESTVREIATDLGVHRGTVYRAIQAIRRELRQLDPELC